MGALKIQGNEEFKKEVLEAEGYVMVDFWAAWCGPCKMVLPIVEEIAEEGHTTKIAKVNVDDNQDLARQYQVEVIPTLALFKDGKVVDKLVGVVSKDDILKLISK